MADGTVEAIYICPQAGDLMQRVEEVEAIIGAGLRGDRYATGQGSFNKGKMGNRQVTLINAIFLEGAHFEGIHSRRNIVVRGVELMWLIGREFVVGQALMRGVKYCDPCARPSKISGHPIDFKTAFMDRGGLIAQVVRGGIIQTGCPVIPPQKEY